jgi:hypothetical protein
MGVSVQPVDGADVPERMRDEGARWAYRVTSWDGSLHYFRTGEEAARFAFTVHRADRAQHGLDDDTDL